MALSISFTIAQDTLKKTNPSAKHHKRQEKKGQAGYEKAHNKEQPVTLIHHNRDI